MEGQRKLREYVPGFRFHLGFSGKFFKTGTPEENEGDEEIIRRPLLVLAFRAQLRMKATCRDWKG